MTEPALHLAVHLDALLPRADDAEHDALLEIGKLTGGLSILGFVHDLTRHLDAVWQDARRHAPLWSQPDVEAERAREAEAWAWLQTAQEIMARAKVMGAI